MAAGNPTKAELAQLVQQQAEAIAALQAQAQSAGRTQRKAERIQTVRGAYRDGGDTKLILVSGKRIRVRLSQQEAEAVVKAAQGFDWSPGATVYEVPKDA